MICYLFLFVFIINIRLLLFFLKNTLSSFSLDHFYKFILEFKDYIEAYDNIYQCSINDIDSIFLKIQKTLIEKYHIPILRIINQIKYLSEDNEKYRSYYKLICEKLINEYPQETKNVHKIIQENYNKNSLLYAIIFDDIEQLRYLFSNDKVDVNQIIAGKTILECCTFFGSEHCFRFLRNNGAQITKDCANMSFHGRNSSVISECIHYEKPTQEAMDYTVLTHSVDQSLFLRNNFDLSLDIYPIITYNNFYLYLILLQEDISNIIYAPFFGIENFTHYILNNYEYKSLRNEDGKTILHFAIYSRNINILKMLLNDGIDIMILDKDNKTALHYAAMHDNIEMCSIFIDKGLDINAKDKYNQTPLQIALSEKNFNIALYLLNHGADFNIENDHGKNPLHYASENNCIEIIEFLFNHGFNLNQSNYFGKTAIDYARQNNCKEALEFLESKVNLTNN